MSAATGSELYVRGAATLLASWDEYARGSAGAVKRLKGVAAAVFPSGPERQLYNNALPDRDLAPNELASALNVMESAYTSAGVDRYAVWAHENDQGLQADLAARGYTIDTSTRAMGMSLDDIPVVVPDAGIERLEDWDEYLEYLWSVGVPAGLLSGAEPSAFHVLVARIDGENVATALAFDHEGDCGIYNMSTLDSFRRRGLGTALTARHVREATERGCSTASLQSTRMAERVYAAVGFGDLGRFLEYVPGPAA